MSYANSLTIPKIANVEDQSELSEYTRGVQQVFTLTMKDW